MANKILFLGFDSEYNLYEISEVSSQYDVKRIEVGKGYIFIFRALKLISVYLSSIFSTLYFHIRLKRFSEYHLILSDNLLYTPAIMLKNNFPSKSLVFRNKIINPTPYLKFFNALDVKCYTYDESDAHKFNINLYTQYCPDPNVIIKSCHIEQETSFDFYFIGLDKGRRKIVENLKAKLENKYNYNIVIVNERSSLVKWVAEKIGFVKNNRLSYVENIKNTMQSRVVIDIVGKNTTGVTMRTLEALKLGKKVITNNSNVCKLNIYNKKNIFIFDEDNIEIPSDDFIYGSFDEITENKLEEISFIYFINKLI